MILNNVKILSADQAVSIRIRNGKIEQILPGHFHDKTEPFDLIFDNAVIFPGLINSHDHLDFNLFPALGNKTYKNYTEWGKHLHKHYKTEIEQVLKVPEVLREKWGIYKNLLCGVTTVVNHGKKISVTDSPITIYQDCQSIHSVKFDKKWFCRLNNLFKKKLPVAIHCGEGTDQSALKEIDHLKNWNLLKRDLIAVHGVAMTENQAPAFKGLVWCPESNYFLLGKTAPVNCLKKHLPILLGTDSTLTGDWNIWKHIQLARKTKLLSDQELYDSLTINPAKTWGLNEGEILKDRSANLVIVKAHDYLNGYDSFFSVNPKKILMVIHQGNIVLFDEELWAQLKHIDLSVYSKINIGGVYKFVYGNLSGLMQEIKQFYPTAEFPVI